jgi:uncharacterized repeat protein (TIGR03803 family)
VQNGPEQVLYAFQGGNDGEYPSSGLIFDSSGNLYGTAAYGGGGACTDPGGYAGCGTVFELSPNGNGGWTETVLYSFKGGGGEKPTSGVIFDQAGNLYGTTLAGGTDGEGTVFELSPNGNGGWTETVLYSFQGGSDGYYPEGVIFDGKGNLYGITVYGGIHDCYKFFGTCGTVFELSPNGSGGWIKTTIYEFMANNGDDGYAPNAGLIFDHFGNLYGTTNLGGQVGGGIVFELSPNGSGGWSETILYDFLGGSDGSAPGAGVIFDQSGNLYGTTIWEGARCNFGNGCGTVFELSPNGSGGWTKTILYSFLGYNDGWWPTAVLTFDSSGNLYSTTLYGGGDGCGNNGCGTVFELSPNGSGGWTESILYGFQGGSDGGSPSYGLILDQAGHLYGTAPEGGPCCGVVFEVTKEAFGTFSPANLNFGNQTVGIASSPQVVTLTDSGGLPLTITSIDVTGVNSGDFDQTNNCPASLAAHSSCTINVTFTPTAAGNRSAAVAVTDNAPSSPQSLPLSGVGVLPAVTFSPASLNFSNQTVGTKSSPQVTTVTNTGAGTLNITSIGITGTNSSEFAETNNCPSSLSPSDSCKISVTFAPTALGSAAALLSVADNAPGSPQGASLTGTADVGDFSLSVTSQTSVTVTPGQAANYGIAVSPVDGFAQKVSLSCSGAPAQSTCTISPSSVTLNGTDSAPANVAVVTSGSSASVLRPAGFPSASTRYALWLAFSGLPGVMLLGSGFRKRHSRVLYGLLLLCVLLLVLTWSGCGGGSGSGAGTVGTPLGTYTLTVTGTYTAGPANLVHSTKLTLVVQ